VTDALTSVLKSHPTSWWIEKLEALQIGCGPINRLSEVFADPHVLARGNLIEMRHRSGTMVKLVANPVRLSKTPPDYRLAPPMLGEHTDDVLQRWIDLDAHSRAELRGQGII
jgi:crotonobetainyl-CoA:carnitine CoA-transferase CaiB-like acyl-CoA transferase